MLIRRGLSSVEKEREEGSGIVDSVYDVVTVHVAASSLRHL